jgi:DNA-binding NtrC family response regulator
VNPKRLKVLVVDDEPDMAESVELVLRGAGHEAIVETQSEAALAVVERERPDVVITDLRMPGLDGLGLLTRIKEAHPEVPVIVLTGYASIDSAVEAMRRGAADFLSKPFVPDELVFKVQKALAWERLAEENRLLRERVQKDGRHGPCIIGASPGFAEVMKLVDKVAQTDARVLLAGESGTGKELIARAIHERSRRSQASFFAIDCGAESLLESELFGHERGAFPGAVGVRRGLLEVADGGTLFLDEIAETSAALQARLLRVVQDGEFVRLGGSRPIKTDVRIISSTNRDPKRAVAEGRLREDLFFRLSVVQIQLPPLRQRVEDIPLLALHFARLYAKETKKKVTEIAADAMEALEQYPWPGNVRELQNVIERAVIMAEADGEIRTEDLPPDVVEKRAEESQDARGVLREAERELITRTLRECHWNRSLAAKKLGIGRRTLYDKLARLGISLHPEG